MAKKLGRKAAEANNHEANGDGEEAGKPKKLRQKVMEGDGLPGPIPEEVCDARDEFLSAMRAAAKAGEKKGEKEQKLIEVMHKYEMTRVPLEGEKKFFDIEAPEKIKMKTLPKEQRDERAAREHATAG